MINSYSKTIFPLLFSCEIPILIKSEANNHDHWTVKRKRRQDQQLLVRAALFNDFDYFIELLPVRVVLTRLYPRFLDTDNLAFSFKGIRDEIADFLFIPVTGKFAKRPKGYFDSSPLIEWEYKQEKSKLKGCKIEIFKL